MKSHLETALPSVVATVIVGGVYHIGRIEGELIRYQNMPIAVLQEGKGKMSKSQQAQAIRNLWEG